MTTESPYDPEPKPSYWNKFKNYLKGLKAKWQNRKKPDNTLPEPDPVVVETPPEENL